MSIHRFNGCRFVAAALGLSTFLLPRLGFADSNTGTINPDTVNVRDVTVTTVPRPADDRADLLAVDSANNYYVRAGYRGLIDTAIKYNSAGAEVWRRTRTVRTDSSTGLYYESWYPGGPETQITYRESLTSVNLMAVAVDGQGNVTLGFDTYYYVNTNPTTRTYFVRFDAAGNLLSRLMAVGQYDYEASGGGIFHTVVSLLSGVDGLTYALVQEIVTGYGSARTVVYALDAAGAKRYVAEFGEDADGDDYTLSTPLALAVNASGQAYVVSSDVRQPNSPASSAPTGWTIRKLDGTGAIAAKVVYPRVDPTDNYASDTWRFASLDATGNLFIAGDYLRTQDDFNHPETGHAGQMLRKFDANLTPLWRVLGVDPPHQTSGQPQVFVRGFAVTAAGLTVSGGTFDEGTGPSSENDSWEIARYSADDGHLIWHRLYAESPTQANAGNESTGGPCVVDADGNVYVSGLVPSLTAGQSIDIALAKYSNVGDLQFVKHLHQHAYEGIQTDPLFLPPNGRPTLFASVGDGDGTFPYVVIDVDNPAVVPLTHPSFFNGEAALGSGAYYLAFSNGNYFGYYSYLADPHYIYHFDMGYEYLFDAADGRGGVYFYDFKSNGFFYSSPSFPFPYLYDFGLHTVLYYYPDPDHAGHYNTDGYRFFYRFDNGQTIVK